MKKDTRFRNWAFVVYPENVTEDILIDTLNSLHIQFVVSPLHEFDVNPDGSPKKPHWHVCLCFSGNKSFDQIKEITDQFNSPIPIKVQSVKGMVRYFAHLDNPEKYQYDPSKIRFFGGLSSDDVLPLSSTERYKIIKDMCIFIIDNHIIDFNDFLIFCFTYHFDDWFPVLSDHSTLLIKESIKSNWLKLHSRVGE